VLIAVVSDIHGDTEALRCALQQAQDAGYDELVSVGDLVDYRDPVDPDAPLDAVVRWDDALSDLTRSATLVRGNQEERVLAFLGTRDIPLRLRRILQSPVELRRWGFTFSHGHRYVGQYVAEDRWVPLEARFDTPTLIHGHHHRNSVVSLAPGSRWADAVDAPLESGRPVRLDPRGRHLVNVGATQGPAPSWGMVDSVRHTYTPHFTDVRFRKQVP
jgi:predicted phosphodiesterase